MGFSTDRQRKKVMSLNKHGSVVHASDVEKKKIDRLRKKPNNVKLMNIANKLKKKNDIRSIEFEYDKNIIWYSDSHGTHKIHV